MELRKRIKRFLKKIYYYGTNYYCPNCRSSLREFVFCGTESQVSLERQIIGAGRRKKECPVCRAAERDRLVYTYVKDYLGLFNKEEKINILHIAPEDCLFPAFYKNINHRAYICGDKFDAGYSYDKQVIYMDITQIDREDNCFDLIICNHVLEHIPDDKTALKELYRVLKPGGKAILQVPLSPVLAETFEDFSLKNPDDRTRIFGQHNHCRIYGQDYGKRLEEAGFRFSPVQIQGSQYQKYGFDERENVMVGEKNFPDKKTERLC
jgi:SAM-dependent methyltransferase